LLRKLIEESTDFRSWRHFSDVTDYADDVRSWGKPFVPLDGTTGIFQKNAKHFPAL
jgi:hypothetical protein